MSGIPARKKAQRRFKLRLTSKFDTRKIDSCTHTTSVYRSRKAYVVGLKVGYPAIWHFPGVPLISVCSCHRSQAFFNPPTVQIPHVCMCTRFTPRHPGFNEVFSHLCFFLQRVISKTAVFFGVTLQTSTLGKTATDAHGSLRSLHADLSRRG